MESVTINIRKNAKFKILHIDNHRRLAYGILMVRDIEDDPLSLKHIFTELYIDALLNNQVSH